MAPSRHPAQGCLLFSVIHGIVVQLLLFPGTSQSPEIDSALVPRSLAALGLIGGPLICASGVAVMFGVFDQGGPGQRIADHPGVHLGAGTRHLPDRQRIHAVPERCAIRPRRRARCRIRRCRTRVSDVDDRGVRCGWRLLVRRLLRQRYLSYKPSSLLKKSNSALTDEHAYRGRFIDSALSSCETVPAC